MSRRLLPLLLLLSLGLNLGLVLPRLLRGGDEPRETPDSESDPKRRAPIFLRMADELHLEGELRERFLDRQQRFLEESFDTRATLERVQGELRAELVGTDPDRPRVDELLAELGDAHRRLESLFVHNLLDTREMLGPPRERRYLRLMAELRKAHADPRRRLWERWRRRALENPHRREGPAAEKNGTQERKHPAETG
jgi:hypothetical protein